MASIRAQRRARTSWITMAVVMMVLGILMLWVSGWFTPVY